MFLSRTVTSKSRSQTLFKYHVNVFRVSHASRKTRPIAHENQRLQIFLLNYEHVQIINRKEEQSALFTGTVVARCFHRLMFQ